MASTPKLYYNDYTVEWICALPIEMTAARLMLDEVHEDLPMPLHDQNCYTLGRIGKHGVVIACLPDGQYGIASAAAVAMQLLANFHSIRFGLMVGIGGGIPNGNVDIRLGDVVVSKPNLTHGGVVQYDSGKALSGGRFERTGMLNQPPQILLRALAKLEAKHSAGNCQFPQYLADMAMNLGQQASGFSHPGQEDRLFQTDYDHVEDAKTCEYCDPMETIQRVSRQSTQPVVHYGLIASGNQVIKDSRMRDRLSEDLGAYCVEMEAAGLMNSFPCLVIRGICDYSDSHKNKAWQAYAAATAAAYAKELLSVIHEKYVTENKATLSVTTYGIYHGNSQHYLAKPGYTDDAEQLRQILERLSDYDPERVHRRLSSKRVIGTTQWFLHHPNYKEWFTGKRYPILWCSGKIGSGKTMIATSVIDALQHRSSELQTGPTVFYFCEDELRLPSQKQAFYIVSSMIKQLCEFLTLRSIPYPGSTLELLKNFYGHKRLVPDFEDIKLLFKRLFHHVPITTYVVDGLDILNSREAQTLLKFLRDLFDSSYQQHQSQLLLFSRDQIPGYLDLSHFFPGICKISTSTNNMQDIQEYIRAKVVDKMMDKKLTDNAQLLQELSRDLLKKSSGMFLWVYLQLEVIWDECFTDNEIREALEQLPKGLDETYQRCINRIEGSKDGRPIKALKWISYASRPLHIDELREAIAFDLHDTAWDRGKIPSRDYVAGCCANLAVLDANDDCVYFAHSSVKQYLETYIAHRNQGYPTSSSRGELECGELCITYLSFSDFGLELGKYDAFVSHPVSPMTLAIQSVGPSLLRNILVGRAPKGYSSYAMKIQMINNIPIPDLHYRFLNYAVSNWPRQTRNINQQSIVWTKFQQLTLTYSETWNFHPWRASGRSRVSHLHGLLIWAIKEQHQPLLSIVLKLRGDLRQICDLPAIEERMPALHIASRLGDEAVVRTLLEICKVNMLDEDGYTPLHHAAIKGHMRVAQLLLDSRDSQVNIESNTQLTPLWFAAKYGHETLVKLFLDKGANIEAQDEDRWTPLLLAAYGGHEITVKLLLDKGADTEARDIACNTALLYAVRYSHEAVVKLLLDKGAYAGVRDIKSNTALSYAVRYGHEAVVKLLLDKGADIEAKDEGGLTPLLVAAYNGHELIVMLLLDKGADIEAKDEGGLTPLLFAAYNGHELTVMLLLDKGADIEATNKEGRPPLLYAVRYNHESTVKLLLERGANIEAKDRYGLTPLYIAERYHHDIVLKLLRDKRTSLEEQRKF